VAIVVLIATVNILSAGVMQQELTFVDRPVQVIVPDDFDPRGT
jgi:hypothetical protein